MTLIIISGGIDLSVGSVIALCERPGRPAARIITSRRSSPIVLAAVALGGVTGAVNGSLITGLRVTPFIVTLGTLGHRAGPGEPGWRTSRRSTRLGAWLDGAGGHPSRTRAWLQVAPGAWITMLALAVADRRSCCARPC